MRSKRVPFSLAYYCIAQRQAVENTTLVSADAFAVNARTSLIVDGLYDCWQQAVSARRR